MSNALLKVEGLSKAFGALKATDRVDLEVQEGETLAIIGPNGAGKTTLISQLAGNLRPDAGSIRFAGEDVTALPAPRRARRGFARSFQITSVFAEFTALQNVALAVQAHAGHSFRFWRPVHEDAALTGPAREFLAQVGLQSRAHVVAANLSHGEHRQRYVVQRGEVAVDAGDLERAREALLRALRCRQARHVLARETDAAGVGPQVARELADERGLAGAVGSDDRVRLPLAQVQGDVVGGRERAEGLAQRARLEDRLSHPCRPRAGARRARA